MTKDIDYLAISARIRAMEGSLLTRERTEQLLEARTGDEVEKVLQECGYPELDPSRPEDMDAALSGVRKRVLEDLLIGTPDPRFIDIFKLKYDYHNVKSILKAKAMGVSPDRMLMDMGRVPARELKDAMEGGELSLLPAMLASAAAEAREVLETTKDPQLSDILLDRWCYRDMAAVAGETGSAFLMGYVRRQVDAVNLRALVRALRMGKNENFLAGVLCGGGETAEDAILRVGAERGAGLAELYAATPFEAAAAEGAQALRGGSLIAFEKLCDDAVADYLADAGLTAFGEAPLLGYLSARETEYMNLRILLTGRYAGLAPEVIKARLRAGYV